MPFIFSTRPSQKPKPRTGTTIVTHPFTYHRNHPQQSPTPRCRREIPSAYLPALIPNPKVSHTLENCDWINWKTLGPCLSSLLYLKRKDQLKGKLCSQALQEEASSDLKVRRGVAWYSLEWETGGHLVQFLFFILGAGSRME